MKFLDIKKIDGGDFLSRYEVSYELNGNVKVYEMFSRSPSIRSKEELGAGTPDAVVVLVLSPDGQKILLVREFRMELGLHIYGLPSGLVDKGEDAVEAAKRELYEETGIKDFELIKFLPASHPAVGLSNERCCCVVGKGSGEPKPAALDEFEDIEAAFYTREEVKRIIENERMGSWSQAFAFGFAYDLFGGLEND